MALSFQPVTLDASGPDRDGALAFRDGRLVAVLSRLSDIHGDLGGRWFVEATFSDMPRRQPQTFETLDHFGDWLKDAA